MSGRNQFKPLNQKDKTMKKETVTIENYQEHAMRTCLPSARNLNYAVANYTAEMFELFAKCKSYHAKTIRDGTYFNQEKAINAIKDEIGDCFWQLALCCDLIKESFAKAYRKSPVWLNAITPEEMAIGGIDFNENILHIRLCAIEGELSRIKSVCSDFKINPVECLQRNIDKLRSRAERGVIKGNGDER